MSNNTTNTVDNLFLMCYALTVIGITDSTEKVKRLKNDTFKKQINDIVEWSKKYNTKIVFQTDAEDRYESSDNTIFINSRIKPERKYYTLLHECGHLLIDKNWQSFEKDNPMFATSCDKRVSRSRAYLVSTVAEEIEAWKRGRRLAKRLGHALNDEVYDSLISENVMTYIEWAATGGGE